MIQIIIMNNVTILKISTVVKIQSQLFQFAVDVTVVPEHSHFSLSSNDNGMEQISGIL